ncbi:pyridoxal phosphate-dependent aminotransferase [Alkalibacter rhizosphaerae]|uniref:cysteine-S-conjugate beta-lyase n=1 Tax=Alkalibacter rhizosphaerae TaxID=2815577 RepID=A0A975AGS4_9FIRM|nr:MalY/PatB family protein [Alkalibacter rhizosphaerae]QSX07864.1 pyridoxal phosphate-dependent aminotransferase [Alkalibacter rhizosphaerae]
MAYDFIKVPNRRNVGSAKYQQMMDWNPKVEEDIVPFSVADMELANPPEIIKGLQDYLEDAVLGYTMPTKAYKQAVAGWMKRRHQWEIQEEWMLTAPGVVHAFFTGVQAYSDPGDGVIVMPPVYYPFYRAIEANGRKVVSNPLALEEGRYVIDYEDLEKKAKDPSNKVLLFCSPHNPVGRVWTKEELVQVAKICLENQVVMLSDEIHFDLILPGHVHTVMASLSEEAAKQTVVFTAPSKTFNLAGMQTSNIIIPDEKLRKKYEDEAAKTGIFGLNILGYKACEIAYTQCEGWLEEFLVLLEKNHQIVKEFFKVQLPDVTVFDLEGTYLQWMDFRKFGLSKEELEHVMQQKAQVFFDEGYVFGEEGAGFERMNLACPTWVLEEGLMRIKEALQ